MKCPYCGIKTKVTNSRSSIKGTQTWRRRICKKCLQLWTTQEVIDLSKSHEVMGANNSSEPFSRDELFISIKDSLQHRKTALVDATALTDTVLVQVLLLNSARIAREKISAITTPIITRFDKTAGAVYRAKHKKLKG